MCLHKISRSANKGRIISVLVLLLLVLVVILAIALSGSASAYHGSGILALVPLVDGHNDLPNNLRELNNNFLSNFSFEKNLSTDSVWNCSSCFTDLPRLRAGQVGAQFWVAYVPCSEQYKDAVEMTLEQLDVIRRLIAKYPKDLQLTTTSQGIWDAYKAGKIASLIGIEGGHSIDSRLAVLRQMYEMGARYLTLTHSCSTPWAVASPQDELDTFNGTGLTEFGKAVVTEMNRLGMMVDLSHVAYRTMIDAINVSKAPVIFSHSSAYAICNHHRNVRDDVLMMVKKNDGVVMVNFYSEYVNCNRSRDATIEDVVAHINHIRNVAGVDHVGIGADYDGVSQMPIGLEDVSKYPNLFQRLADSRPGVPDWNELDLKKLAALNLLRVFKKVEQVKEIQKRNEPNDVRLLTADLGNNMCRS